MRIYIFSVLTCFLLLLTSCSQYFQDPVAYNDSLVDIYNAAVNDFNAYDTYYVETSWQFFDNIENRRIRTIDTLQQKKIELEILPELR